MSGPTLSRPNAIIVHERRDKIQRERKTRANATTYATQAEKGCHTRRQKISGPFTVGDHEEVVGPISPPVAKIPQRVLGARQNSHSHSQLYRCDRSALRIELANWHLLHGPRTFAQPPPALFLPSSSSHAAKTMMHNRGPKNEGAHTKAICTKPWFEKNQILKKSRAWRTKPK